MPQMMPMYWIIIFSLSIFTFFLLFFFTYFIHINPIINLINSNFKINKWLWTW